MDVLHSEVYRGYLIEIMPDDDPESPRKYDNVGTMVCWHSRYNLGDEQPKFDSREWLRSLAESAVNVNSIDDVPDEHIQRILDKHYVILPLYLYDHSGITMRCSAFSCPWDSGQVGYIYCSVVKAQEEFPGTREESIAKARNCLEQEVKVYDSYLTNSYVGYRITRKGNETGSCWGFESQDYGLEEARREVSSHIKYRREKERKRVENGGHVCI